MSNKLRRLLTFALVLVFMVSTTTQAFAFGGHGGPGGPGGGGHPEEDPGYTSHSIDNLNFFINLAGDILDVAGASSQHASSLFTDKLTEEFDVDGDDLQVDVCNSEFYAINDSYYDSIVGEDDESYQSIDTEIRSILGNYISVPSDSDILGEIKTQIADGTKIYDINGELVYESLVSTDYYDVYWYVLKEGADFWHVDGVLVKKSVPLVNVYDVTYSWTTESTYTIPSALEVPEKVAYAENDPVAPDTTYYSGYTYEDTVNDGVWTFSGWSITEQFNITEDTEITGEWTFTLNEQDPEPPPPSTNLYTVSYEWTVEEGGPGLPDTIVLPAGESRNTHYLHSVNGDYYEGIEVTVTGGKYVFSGWYGYTTDQNVALEPGHHVALDETRPSVVIHGSWDWVEDTPDAPVTYKYEIHYYDIHGGTVRDTASGTIEAGARWGLDHLIPSFVDNGKTFIRKEGSPSSGENCQADVVIDTYYKGFYNNIISYVDIDTSTEIKDTFGEQVECCSDWDYTDKIPNEIIYNNETYSLVDVTGNVSGENIVNDNIISARYRKSITPPEEVPDNPVIYSVSYEWTVSGGPGLPTTATPPAGESSNAEFNHLVDRTYYAGSEVTVTGGKYVFSGWLSKWASDDIVKVRANNNPVVIRGSWDWIKDEPTPMPSTPSKKTYYTIEVEYVDSNGTEIADDYKISVRKGRNYDVTDEVPNSIMLGDQEYTLKTTTGDPLSGVANSNKKITAWYELKPVINPPTNPPVVTPPVEEPPVVTPPVEEPPVVTPPVEEPKKDETPKTGDLLPLSVFSSISSLAGIFFLNRKRKEG